jgi:hypothetical protein
VGVALTLAFRRSAFRVDQSSPAGRLPRIRPDYTGLVIPPNVAPLNFLVEEPGTRYWARIYSAKGEEITVASRSPALLIPLKPWRRLLQVSRGGTVCWDIHVRRQDGRWTRFDTVRNVVAAEDIDAYLVYRKIRPLYTLWTDVGVYQRNLTNYQESQVLHGEQVFSGGNACVNCHAFRNNRTDAMAIGVRSPGYGSSTPILHGGQVRKLDAKFGYTSWHPSGKLVAYSINNVRQFFRAGGVEVRDVIDFDSDLVYYRLGAPEVSTSPSISDAARLETYPAWSPDGQYLYFSSAAIPWSADSPVERYREVRYDLMRIRYDVGADKWGDPETVLSSGRTGLSILLPRVSPDGRFVLFCMCRYGCFPIYQPSSDLYLLDIETGAHERLSVNSDRSESWHAWSGNGRWFVFSSKRNDGLFTRLYMSYFDRDGKAHKPVLLPQETPTFYDSCLHTYTVPELVAEAVQVSSRALARAVRSPGKVRLGMPDVSTMREMSKGHPWRPATPERE